MDLNPILERALIQWVDEGGTLLHGPRDALAARCFGVVKKRQIRQPWKS